MTTQDIKTSKSFINHSNYCYTRKNTTQKTYIKTNSLIKIKN